MLKGTLMSYGGEYKIILYALFYYDKNLLAPWLSHYCQLDGITEIIIQDQNWSLENTLYLLKTVARYIDETGKKIVILPSQFEHIKGKNKRSQFLHYGQSEIRNRIMQFLKGDVFIAGAMDEVIYGENYEDTEEKLKEFEETAIKRAAQKKLTVGFFPLYCVLKDGIYPQAYTFDHKRAKHGEQPNWRHRIFRFPMPFRRSLDTPKAHDTTYEVQIEGEWSKKTPASSIPHRDSHTDNEDHYVFLDLKLLHYHTLVRASFETSDFCIPENVNNRKDHPKAYIDVLLNQS